VRWVHGQGWTVSLATPSQQTRMPQNGLIIGERQLSIEPSDMEAGKGDFSKALFLHFAAPSVQGGAAPIWLSFGEFKILG